MGGFISGLLGTNSSVSTTSQSAQGALQPYLNSQSQLAQQVQGVANGTGPNPALNQLNQTTQQNAQQAASTLASQRGLNAGLAARTAAQNQVNANQQAAGQAATLGAQQQIAAQQQLAGIYGQQEGATNQASAINAGIASGNQQASQGIIGGVLGGVGSALGLAHGGAVPTKMADGGLLSSGNLTVTPTSSSGGGGPMSSVGQYLSGNNSGSSAMQSGLTSVGGGIHSAMNKSSAPNNDPAPTGIPSDQDWANTMSAPSPDTGGGNATSDQWASMMAPGMAQGGLAQKAIQLAPVAAMFAAKGGKVPVVLSPGEKKLSPEAAKKVALGKADPMKTGGTVPGKAKVPGDSLKNDVVPDKLEPGSIVIPRSVVQSKHPHFAAMKFVQAHLGIAPSKKSKKVAA